jgi:acetylornithine deacetylase/succinyl-diaminopimelate desuccinylase-like protein
MSRTLRGAGRSITRVGLERDAVTLLQRLVRHRTVNPPGDERPLQEELAADLRAAGFEVTLLGRTEARPNLVARLRAEGGADGPRLCLLSHVDTVLADPQDWTVDPWGGEERDGHIWGRGAVDMKSQTAAEVAAAIDLARSGWRPARGELMVVAVVDEEVGGTDGAIWLTERHPDLVRCDELLNEGGGARIPWDGAPLFGVCVAEKGVFRFTLETRGAAGHASMPGLGDNALPKLAPLLQAMAERRPPADMTEAPRLLLGALGVDGVDALRERDPLLAGFVEPMTGITLAPTMVTGSEKVNVLPARASVRVDCRTPPGMGPAEAERRVREVLGEGEYELRFDEQVVGNGSPAQTELYAAIERWVAGEVPGARVVPTMLPAYTDSRAFRDAFPGCVAYGFFPMLHTDLYEMWPRVHGADERIDVRDVEAAARAYRAIVEDRLGRA